MNAIRWSEHRLYAALVSRVPDELHATLARAADLISAYAWLRDGTRPAGLDDGGKSLDGLEGPAFIRAVGRRYMRRWVLDDDDDRFGQSEAEKLVADWTDEVLLFSSAAGGGRRAVSWLPGRVEEMDGLVDRDTLASRGVTYRYYTLTELCEAKERKHFLGLYARGRRQKAYEVIDRPRADERIALNPAARETLGWVLRKRLRAMEEVL